MGYWKTQPNLRNEVGTGFVRILFEPVPTMMKDMR